MTVKSIIWIMMLCAVLLAGELTLQSPDKSVKVKVSWGASINLQITGETDRIFDVNDIGLKLQGNKGLDGELTLKDHQLTTVDEVLQPVVRQKSREVRDHFNQLKINFTNGLGFIVRAFDDGVAYRLVIGLDETLIIRNESMELHFAAADTIFYPLEESMMSHNERTYLKLPMDSVKVSSFCSLPALVKSAAGYRILITEADLTDYPGLWLQAGPSGRFRAKFAPYPLSFQLKRDRDEIITESADYIARTAGNRSFPWRAFIISKDDGGLIASQMVYKLSQSCQLADPSWIKPGKVAWDWWNANNIYGVDFKSGVNTETYKFYIDFASRHGLEYIILDEGWYVLGDVLKISPGMDVPEIIRYGKENNVGIILWVVWKTLDDQLQEALEQFEKWGAAGIKVDFMQRDDQVMVNYYHKIAREAARRKLLVDFHGSYKPAGLHRMYPNVITREGVKGLEHCKWSADITPEHDTTLPFIRMVAGPMDYTPGAMINRSMKNFNPVFEQPMSMTTRCHQLGLYVVFESPLQMLADSPSNYLKEEECMEFLDAVPTVWDETRVLQAAIGDYVCIARRNGEKWFIGAIGDEYPHDLKIDLSFLKRGQYTLTVWQDGINADRTASDYKKTNRIINSGEVIPIHLAPGGGWAAIISERK